MRYAGETDATVWVETDAACEVDVLGCRSRTFCVEGHHYALVHVTGLEPGGQYEYEVLLDGVLTEPTSSKATSASSPSRAVIEGKPRLILVLRFARRMARPLHAALLTSLFQREG